MPELLRALAAKRKLRVAGLMSGTSADGVDVAIIAISDRRVKLLAFGKRRYPPKLREKIFKLFRPETSRVNDICLMNFVLGEFFAEALTEVCEKTRLPIASVDVIASHGQTIYHVPRGRSRLGGATLQIAEPCVIAERTGITTVADFRPRDIAAGGEGAPLVPYADFVLFRHPRLNRIVLNIGGIANLTWLPAGCAIRQVIAFDTGPGNMLIDHLVWLVTRGRNRFDSGGRIAARGRVNAALLAELMAHAFLRKRPPKSTGREEFGVQFADRVFRRAKRERIRASDIVATATAFTARSIGDACRRFLPRPADEVILCGGGSRNRALVAMLARELPHARFRVTDEFGIPVEAKEAVSFAILARETIRGVPNNVPSATGAARPVVLGKIIPGSL